MRYSQLFRIAIIGTLFSAFPGHRAEAQRLEFSGCSSVEQSRIRTQLKWLRLNQRTLVDSIKERQPDAFLGQSEKRLTTFFRTSVTKLQCSKDAVLCGAQTAAYAIDDLKFPLPYRYPLTLCIDYLQNDDALTIALAHQLGRHILINRDKAECTQRCTAPNLAVLFSQTTHSMLTNQPFSMEWCLTACAPPREIPTPPLPLEQSTGVSPDMPSTQSPIRVDEKPTAPSLNSDP